MTLSALELTLLIVAALAIGAGVAWTYRGRRIEELLKNAEEGMQAKLTRLSRQKERLLFETTTMKTSLRAERTLVKKHESAATVGRGELQSARARAESLAAELKQAREREGDLTETLTATHSALTTAQHRLQSQTEEFKNTREYYTAQLAGALQQRKSLEQQLAMSHREHESLRSMLLSVKSEQELSAEELETLESQQAEYDELEARYIAIQAECAELRQQTTESQAQTEALRRRLASLNGAGGSAADGAVTKQTTSESVSQAAGAAEDDLTQIAGIGKAFAKRLNDMGVYQFQQLAELDPQQLDHPGCELREFRNRILRDDWIGQATQLNSDRWESGD